MSDTQWVATIIRAINADMTQDELTADTLRLVGLCLSRNMPVQVLTALEQQATPVPTGDRLIYFSPLGTQVSFGTDLTDAPDWFAALNDQYDEPGLFVTFAPGADAAKPLPWSKPLPRPCSDDTLAKDVAFADLADFDKQREDGGFGRAPDAALDAIRVHLVANCGETAKCGGTLGPTCK